MKNTKAIQENVRRVKKSISIKVLMVADAIVLLEVGFIVFPHKYANSSVT